VKFPDIYPLIVPEEPIHPLNCAGSFYGTTRYIDTVDAWKEAAGLMESDGVYSWVRRQPESPADIELLRAVMDLGCHSTVRYRGSQPAILKEFSSLWCDADYRSDWAEPEKLDGSIKPLPPRLLYQPALIVRALEARPFEQVTGIMNEALRLLRDVAPEKRLLIMQCGVALGSDERAVAPEWSPDLDLARWFVDYYTGKNLVPEPLFAGALAEVLGFDPAAVARLAEGAAAPPPQPEAEGWMSIPPSILRRLRALASPEEIAAAVKNAVHMASTCDEETRLRMVAMGELLVEEGVESAPEFLGCLEEVEQFWSLARSQCTLPEILLAGALREQLGPGIPPPLP